MTPLIRGLYLAKEVRVGSPLPAGFVAPPHIDIEALLKQNPCPPQRESA